LARQLCGGAFRSARTLSEASLAGGSGERAADAAREAAGNVISKFGCRHPRKRVIQYSEVLRIHRIFTAYWMPAFAGMTATMVER
jgi:hypothetical protein